MSITSSSRGQQNFELLLRSMGSLMRGQVEATERINGLVEHWIKLEAYLQDLEERCAEAIAELQMRTLVADLKAELLSLRYRSEMKDLARIKRLFLASEIQKPGEWKVKMSS